MCCNPGFDLLKQLGIHDPSGPVHGRQPSAFQVWAMDAKVFNCIRIDATMLRLPLGPDAIERLQQHPRVGFIATNMARVAEKVVGFYNKRGTCEQWIKEGKGAIKWTRLSCRAFAANAVCTENPIRAW